MENKIQTYQVLMYILSEKFFLTLYGLYMYIHTCNVYFFYTHTHTHQYISIDKEMFL